MIHAERPLEYLFSASRIHVGATGFLELTAEQGRVCTAGGRDLVVVVVCEARVNVGLLRVELLRAAGQLP